MCKSTQYGPTLKREGWVIVFVCIAYTVKKSIVISGRQNYVLLTVLRGGPPIKARHKNKMADGQCYKTGG